VWLFYDGVAEDLIICTHVGDNKATAEAICRMIGVFDAGEDISKLSFTGRDFSDMPEEQQEALLRAKSNLVFSRAEPKHKQVGSAGSSGAVQGCPV